MYEELIKALRERAAWINFPNHGEEYPVREAKLMYDAADAIEELSMKLHGDEAAIAGMKREIERMVVNGTPRWIPVTERLPEAGDHVLLACKCRSGSYVCDGFHTEKYSTPTHFYEDIDADYNEVEDKYYFPEGWWEVIKNWDDYSCVAIEDKITHWQPLPKPPKEEAE